MRNRSLRRARGVALLIVLVVLVLIATLATEIAITSKTHYKLAGHAMEDLLLRSAVDGRIPILKAALRYDGTNGSGYDGEADEWAWRNHEKLSGWGERGDSNFGEVTGDEAGTIASYDNTNVELSAWCEDERSKINLRGLMKPEDSPVFQHTRDALVRLIDLLRESSSELDLSDGDARDMVEDLVEWLQAEADSEENPMPAVKNNRGRLQSVDDLLRVPGGHWTPERLYDVKDPEATDEEDPDAEPSQSSASGEGDGTWERTNGVGGLARYLTVFAEDAADPAMKINVNTVPAVVLKALFDENDEDLADKIVEHRREGAVEPGAAATPTAGTAPGTSPADQPNQGFFKTKQDLTKVEGMESDLAKYPRLNFFADVTSPVYSLRVIARTARKGANEDSGGDEDTGTNQEIEAVYDYREVVQRTQAGFITLYSERRTDPIFDLQR